MPAASATFLLMKTCDVVLATGGPGVVKAAYSSGKPSYGVGAGNVQCILDDDVDYAKTVPMIIEGRIFDNGIICSGRRSPLWAQERIVSGFPVLRALPDVR